MAETALEQDLAPPIWTRVKRHHCGLGLVDMQQNTDPANCSYKAVVWRMLDASASVSVYTISCATWKVHDLLPRGLGPSVLR